MDWPEALEIVVARTGHERYRALCADDHPDHDIHRRRMIERATGEAPTPATFPSLFRQAAGLAGAVARVAGAVVSGGPVMVPPKVYAARLAVCLSCDDNVARSAGAVRCGRCGCGGAKLALATESCPINKWTKYEADMTPTPPAPRPRRPIELADGTFVDALSEAVRLWMPAAIPATDPAALRNCGRAAALHRLHVRRMAARRQDPGETWATAELFPRLDAELAELAADGTLGGLTDDARETVLRGCGDPACHACCPRTCRTCGLSPGECDLIAAS